jgi:prevent-host-death family protein
MDPVNIYDAKTRLSQLVDRAAAGEDVVICRNGKPVARLTHLKARPTAIRFGLLDGRLVIPDDFDAPLPAEVLEGFEGP